MSTANGLSREQLLAFLGQMLLIRRFEEKVIERFRAGELAGFLHAAIGQEAVAVGVCRALAEGDLMASTHRAHGHVLANGTPASEVMAELYGKNASTRGRRGEERRMERVAIVARLKEGSGTRAAELIAAGPPFDLAETGITRHSVYLSSGEVVFVFEGHQVEWIVDDLIDDPFRPKLQSALDSWRSIVEGSPRIARERFGWRAREPARPVAEAMAGSAS